VDRLVPRQVLERAKPFLGRVDMGHGDVAAERASEETDMAAS